MDLHFESGSRTRTHAASALLGLVVLVSYPPTVCSFAPAAPLKSFSESTRSHHGPFKTQPSQIGRKGLKLSHVEAVVDSVSAAGTFSTDENEEDDPKNMSTEKFMGSKRLSEVRDRLRLAKGRVRETMSRQAWIRITRKCTPSVLKVAVQKYLSKKESPILFGSKRLARVALAVYGLEVVQGDVKTPEDTSNMEVPALTESMLEEAIVEDNSVEDEFDGLNEVELMWLVEKWKSEDEDMKSAGTAMISKQSLVENTEVPQPEEQDEKAVYAPWMVKHAPDERLFAAAKKCPQVLSLGDLTMGRFYEMCKGNPEVSVEQMRKYLEWLDSQVYGEACVRQISPQTKGVLDNIHTGKLYILNKPSKDGNPVVLVHVSKHSTQECELNATTRFVCYALLKAEERLEEPKATQFSIIFDMSKASIKNVDYEAVKRFVHLLTQFYPNRLGCMLIYNAPGFFSTICFPLIRPWLNPATREKVHFVSPSRRPSPSDVTNDKTLAYWIGLDCLPESLGGGDSFDYDEAVRSYNDISFV